MRAKLNEAFQHRLGGVRFDGVMDVRMTQASLQRIILLFDAVAVDDQGRFIECAPGDISVQFWGGDTNRRRSASS